MAHFVITAGFVVGQLQPIERRGTSQSDTFLMQPIQAEGIALVASHGQQRIQAQPIMIIEVFVTQSQAVEPLGHQLLDRVIGITQIAPVSEAGRQRSRQSQALINLAQQQNAPVAGERAAGKIGDYFS